jgi:PPE-repeat protein
MNFATLPPETNSGRMYSGRGPVSMIEAAAIWDGLAAQLHDAAADCGAVTEKLACGWQGPGTIPISQAAAPYVAWLNATGAQAQQTATRAKAAASAYDSAFAAMVPPTVIEANRARRMWLASTNCLGQTSPAIADIEADYERMWTQDADAMYAYARASADASELTRFSSPPSATRPAGGGWALTAAPEVVSTGNQLMSAIPEALEALSVSPLRSFDVSLSPVTASLSKLSSLSAPMDVAIGELNSRNKAAVLENAAALHALIPGRALGAASPSGFGCGMSIGTLSVPAAWAAATARHPVTVEPSRSGWGFEPIRLVKGTAPREA